MVITFIITFPESVWLGMGEHTANPALQRHFEFKARLVYKLHSRLAKDYTVTPSDRGQWWHLKCVTKTDTESTTDSQTTEVSVKIRHVFIKTGTLVYVTFKGHENCKA